VLRAIAKLLLADPAGSLPLRLFSVTPNAPLRAEMALRDEQKSSESKIVGTEGGLAGSAINAVLVGLFVGHAALEPNRLIGTITVAGAIRQSASDTFVIPDAACLGRRPGEANVRIPGMPAVLNSVEADELRPDLRELFAVRIAKLHASSLKCG